MEIKWKNIRQHIGEIQIPKLSQPFLIQDKFRLVLPRERIYSDPCVVVHHTTHSKICSLVEDQKPARKLVFTRNEVGLDIVNLSDTRDVNFVTFFDIYHLVSRQPNGEYLEDGLSFNEPNIFRVFCPQILTQRVCVRWVDSETHWSMSEDNFPNNTRRREFRFKV
jgi:hypothetical protein